MKRLLRDESGSAVVEFIVYALPLFLPLAIFITTFHGSSESNFAAQTLARNILRVYQTGDSILHVQESVVTLINTADQTVLRKFSLRSVPIVTVNCQTYPCLTPANLIQVKVDLYLTNQQNPITAIATGYIDAFAGA